MRIAILCGAYYPNFSAVGLCASRIAEELAAEHEVYVLSVTDREEVPAEFTHNGVNVRKAVPYWEKKKQQALATANGHGFQKKAITTAYKLRRMLSMVLGKYSVRKDFVNACGQLLQAYPAPDLILAFCMPIESLVAAYDYQKANPDTVISMMMYDGFSDARTTHYFPWNRKLKFKRHIGLEHTLFSACKKIFHVHQNTQHLHTYHSDLKDRFIEVEHPNVTPVAAPQNVEKVFEPETINFIYGGGIKKGYIDPSYFIELLQELPGYKLHIYTSESALQQFPEYDQHPEVTFRKWLPQGELLRVQYGAEFLINFATSDGHQISSKIFNYISMGRPFVHIYHADCDSNLVYLKKYPLVLCLDARESIEANRQKLVDWCQKNLGAFMAYDQVAETFADCTPGYICRIMMGELLADGEKEQ